MKNLFILLLTVTSSMLFSQVIIDPGTKTAPSSAAVSLEFGDYEFKGIAVPLVKAVDADAAALSSGISIANGTIIMDPSDHVFKIMINNVWKDYTGNALKTNAINTSIQDLKNESVNARVLIGGQSATDNTLGVLVLAATDKAMVLPRMISPATNIINPSAGLMAYDNVKKQLAVFNGTQWSFWKANP